MQALLLAQKDVDLSGFQPLYELNTSTVMPSPQAILPEANRQSSVREGHRNQFMPKYYLA